MYTIRNLHRLYKFITHSSPTASGAHFFQESVFCVVRYDFANFLFERKCTGHAVEQRIGTIGVLKHLVKIMASFIFIVYIQ